MANTPRGYGLTAECQRKKDAKFDKDLACEALFWISDVLKESERDDICWISDEIYDRVMCCNENENEIEQKDVKEALKDGVALCCLGNEIVPGSIKKFNLPKEGGKLRAFQEMENIGIFLKFCEEKMGCKKHDLFQSVDLWEGRNIPQVINAIFALGRKYRDNPLGPRESSENRREFTEEQIKKSQQIIRLQSGSNKGATQAGINFGKTRTIMD